MSANRNQAFARNGSLSSLLGSVTEETFFRDYYGKKPLFVTAPMSLEGPVPSPTDVLAGLECLELCYGKDYSLRRHVQWLPDTFRQGLEANPKLIPKLLQQKWSLIAYDYHLRHRTAGNIKHRLEAALRVSVRIHGTLIPQESPPADWSAEPYDFFVWQLNGQQDWRVADKQHEPEEHAKAEFTLRPGDLLYVPEAFRTLSTPDPSADSFHLTLEFHNRYGLIKRDLQGVLNDWLQGDLRADLESLALPHQLPPEIHGITRDEVMTAIDALERKIESTSFQESTPAYPLKPDQAADGQLGQANLDEESVLVSKPNWRKGDLRLRPPYTDAISVIETGTPFCPKDLPLKVEDSLALCRTLLCLGALHHPNT